MNAIWFLAFHPADIAGLVAVALLWVGMRRYLKRRGSGSPPSSPDPPRAGDAS